MRELAAEILERNPGVAAAEARARAARSGHPRSRRFRIRSTGTGADVMRRIAGPMVGGVFTSFVAELLVFPAIYLVWRGIKAKKGPLFPAGGDGEEPEPVEA